jgi:hypothetical protein
MSRKPGVSAVVLGKHLDVTNQWVGKLVKQGVLSKLADGTFDLDRCRVAYTSAICARRPTGVSTNRRRHRGHRNSRCGNWS